MFYTLYYFSFSMKVNCTSNWPSIVHIYKSLKDEPLPSHKRKFLPNGNILMQRKRRDSPEKIDNLRKCTSISLPINKMKIGGITYFNTSVSQF